MARETKIKGLESFLRKLKKLGGDYTEELEQGLYEEAEIIMTEAKEKYVPVDLGTLRSSGFVQPPEKKGGKIQVVLGFGGPAAPYAVIVHEDLNAHHDHGQALYLKTPLDMRKKVFFKNLAKKLKAKK